MRLKGACAECYNIMYHAAQHKHDGVHEAALAIVRSVLERSSRAQVQQFHRSMMNALVGVKENARKAVLAQMCAHLVLKKSLPA